MPDSAGDLSGWVGLSLIPGLGPEALRQLLSAFGPPPQIFAASRATLAKVVGEELATRITSGPEIGRVDASLAWLAQPGNHLLTLADAAYPRALLEIADPPPLLYLKGNPTLLHKRVFAIVGSRNATPQGLKNAESFAQALSDAGWCIASGLALGVDGAAHRGALRGSGSTIAVVGTGLDIVYPARHRDLAHEIAQSGLLVSEFPLGAPSRAGHFPRRNRIISGLACGVLVVEANLESGSLITARLAAEQGRDVFAIPGSIHSPLSKGCHRLIKQGAKLVDGIQDILEELGSIPIIQSEEAGDALAEVNPLLACMGYEAVGLDALILASGLTSDRVSAMLLELELQGKVASMPGGRYQRIH